MFFLRQLRAVRRLIRNYFQNTRKCARYEHFSHFFLRLSSHVLPVNATTTIVLWFTQLIIIVDRLHSHTRKTRNSTSGISQARRGIELRKRPRSTSRAKQIKAIRGGSSDLFTDASQLCNVTFKNRKKIAAARTVEQKLFLRLIRSAYHLDGNVHIITSFHE